MRQRILDHLIGGVALAAFVLIVLENTPFGDARPAFFRAANLSVLLIFGMDVLLRIITSADKKEYLRKKWFDLIVFLPLVQFIPALRNPDVLVIIRQVVIVAILLSRSRRAGKLINLLSLRPAQAMVAGFLGAIGIGTVLLMLPLAGATGERTPLVDAVFTSTSAVCVTGLIVQDTATHFSPFGQLVILGLIQAGGLGIMTFSVSLVVFMRRQMNVRERAALQDVLDYDALAGVRELIRFIVLMTFSVELCGAAALFLAWRTHFDGAGTAAYHAIFHSVSAFCNAGFSTFSDSLTRFRGSIGANVVVCLLIFTGGLGFVVIKDLLDLFRARRNARARRLRLQTKVVLTVSLMLVAGGALLFRAMENNGLFASLDRTESWLAAVFQSVTCRTAGFNTVDIAGLSSASLMVCIVLMFVGASPGSTGGGIKTTTVGVLLATVWCALRQRDATEAFRRTIPDEVIRKALCLLCISLMVVAVCAGALMYLEAKPLRDVLFETVSAFGTVGLSTGITPRLSVGGKILVAVLMFIGRLGPLTIAYAFAAGRVPARYTYAEERLMVG